MRQRQRETVAEVPAQRLHKVLAHAGYGSRREMEDLIEAGRVLVNGAVATIGMSVGAQDRVEIDRRHVRLNMLHPVRRIVLYHKPEGEMVTHDDPEGRDTVFRHLPRVQGAKWVAVGRLDYNTSGLLIFTTDGELAHHLMHPRFEVEREYAVRLMGEIEEATMRKLQQGIELDDGPARLDSIADAGGTGSNHWYRVVLREGRNREVRRIFEAVGMMVTRLMRVRFGIVNMPARLKRGTTLELDPSQVLQVARWAGLEAPDAKAPGQPGRAVLEDEPFEPEPARGRRGPPSAAPETRGRRGPPRAAAEGRGPRGPATDAPDARGRRGAARAAPDARGPRPPAAAAPGARGPRGSAAAGPGARSPRGPAAAGPGARGPRGPAAGGAGARNPRGPAAAGPGARSPRGPAAAATERRADRGPVTVPADPRRRRAPESGSPGAAPARRERIAAAPETAGRDRRPGASRVPPRGPARAAPPGPRGPAVPVDGAPPVKRAKAAAGALPRDAQPAEGGRQTLSVRRAPGGDRAGPAERMPTGTRGKRAAAIAGKAGNKAKTGGAAAGRAARPPAGQAAAKSARRSKKT